MKTILKKLHIVGDSAARSPPSNSPPEARNSASEVTNWLNSAALRQDSVDTMPSTSSAASSSGVQIADESGMDEEEYQIQLALELSVREDPEAVQIEAVKQISLGGCHSENTAAEVLAFRYWNYNFLTYDDKILDGFYDLYGALLNSTPLKMPSLVDLQGTPISNNISCEAVIVNRKDDPYLLRLEQKVLQMAFETGAQSLDSTGSLLVQKVAVVVANHMGGKINYPENLSEAYQSLINSLRETVGNIVLPLGRITVGLARHRALLFKVLADSMDVPCILLKGKQHTGSDDGAVNIVKLADGREYIVDLMSEPGTLIPSYGAGLATELEEAGLLTNPFCRDVKSTHMVSSSDVLSGSASYPESKPSRRSSKPQAEYLENPDCSGVTASILSSQSSQRLSSSPYLPSQCNFTVERVGVKSNSKSMTDDTTKVPQSSKSSHPQHFARSPSLSEGISSPAVRRMKVKDVSEYMINAAKENPQLAQKLHDVLLESGVVAPPNLFTEIGTEEPETSIYEDKNLNDTEGEKNFVKDEIKQKTETEDGHGPFLPFLPVNKAQKKVVPSKPSLDMSKPVDGLRFAWPPDSRESTGSPYSSEAYDSQFSDLQLQLIRQMPVAAAAATAAVVASSMVVAAAKTSNDMKLEVPAAAAAVTATAAAVVATTAAVSRQYEQLESSDMPLASGHDGASLTEKVDVLKAMQQNSNEGHDDLVQTSNAAQQESDLISDRLGAGSVKSMSSFEDVAEFEIPWEDIMLGPRIGLGSFGEVYRGDWHGTEVAVKRFLHQTISTEAFEEFISEVRIMKRLRHPNVVLFMGAVTRVPNLSIVTEFLHRGSLFHLIHRPNNQLDERRRLRMALDVARGMNYLHNCTPIIVHRDLKTPNLLVDRNWVVKVCDFGLSRLKHSTFLSSRSTAGTAEWMAPEILRNEPSNEKCDVYSFGVVLWELCTMKQPWEGMNPMQVVGAVGFQHRTLDIPDDMDPVIANIISKCWQTDPRMRPSFLEIMAELKPLQKPGSNSHGMKVKIL